MRDYKSIRKNVVNKILTEKNFLINNKAVLLWPNYRRVFSIRTVAITDRQWPERPNYQRRPVIGSRSECVNIVTGVSKIPHLMFNFQSIEIDSVQSNVFVLL